MYTPILDVDFAFVWCSTDQKRRSAGGPCGPAAVPVVDHQVDAGRVKLNGEVWSARAEAGAAIPPGTAVRVARIDGATAVVTQSVAGPGAVPGVGGTAPHA